MRTTPEGPMVTIVEVKPGANPAWVLVSLSSGEGLAFPLDTWSSLQLYENDTLDVERLEELRAVSERTRALNYALRLLTVRLRSRSELRRRLERKGYGAEAVEEAIAWLVERTYLCDTEFARARVHDRLIGRPTGPRALIGDLRARGVEAGVAETVVAQALEAIPDGEMALARSAARKWLRTRGTRYNDIRKKRDALRAALARRGFGFDAIREVSSGELHAL